MSSSDQLGSAATLEDNDDTVSIQDQLPTDTPPEVEVVVEKDDVTEEDECGGDGGEYTVTTTTTTTDNNQIIHDDENLHGLSIQPNEIPQQPELISIESPSAPILDDGELWQKQPPPTVVVDEEDEEEEEDQQQPSPRFDLMEKPARLVTSCEFVQEDATTAEEIDQLVQQVKNHQLTASQVDMPTTATTSQVDPWEKNSTTTPPTTDPTTEQAAPPVATYDVNRNNDVDVIDAPGPCEPRDLIEGIIFSASYLGSTQLMSKRNPGKHSRMLQAQEAVTRIKASDDEPQPSVEIDLFISTDYVKMLNLQTQVTMIEHSLRSISYIADIGNLLVVMARRKSSPKSDEKESEGAGEQKIVCHVLSSENAHLMAQAIGQAFNVAYQQFLVTNGIESRALSREDYNKLLDDMYHDDLAHYTKNESIKEVWVSKKKGEALGVVVVESGWGSIVPTVILANLQHGGPAEKSGKLNIGDQIISVNGTSLVGLPLASCITIIKGIRSQTIACFKIVSCPPAVTVLIKRPHLQYQLGFSIQDGIICSLMRGGIAERGGVRVGHRIIEINGQSVVATDHDKIVKALVSSVGEIQMKTMPASMFRLLTGQETPIYI